MTKTINGVEYTTFEEGKTITELGIDITRKFIVVYGVTFDEGDILVLERDDGSNSPKFKRLSDGFCDYKTLSFLAYYDERKFITYKGKKIYHGDSIKGKIGHMSSTIQVDGKLSINNNGDIFFCQNSMSGSIADDLMGYLHSWQLLLKSDGTFEYGCEIFVEEEEKNNYDNTIITDIDDVETSHKIQKKLFENGYGIGYDKSKDLENYNFNYIMVDNNKAFWFGYGVPDSYYSKEYKKITAKEFLGEVPDRYYEVGIAEKIEEIKKEREEVYFNYFNKYAQPETKCSGGKTIMSIITNAFKSKENKALEFFNLGTTDNLNEDGRREFISYVYETGDTSKKGFLAKMVEAHKEAKKD